MVIKSLKMVEGTNESFDLFDNKTLITSSNNSAGKTTFLRLLLHSLGYRVPAMRNVDYSKIETTLVFEEKESVYCVSRKDLLSISVSKNGEQDVYFILPTEHLNFLSFVFGNTNFELLNSLLGVIYVDQEKGWSLVNRGTVIGRNRFDIEDFVAGLCEIDVSSLISEKSVLEKENSNLEAMLDIQSIKNENSDDVGAISLMIEENKALLNKLDILNMKIRNENKEIRQIDQSIKNENSFFEYIDSLALEVLLPGGGEITLTKNNLKWKEQITPLLNAQLSIHKQNLKILEREKQSINATINQKITESGVLGEESLGQRTAISLNQLNIDVDECDARIKENKKRIGDINKTIRDKLVDNVSEIKQINKLIKEYARDLSVADKIDDNEKIIFTRDIKSYSGAILKKLSLAFKMAFHKRLEKYLDTRLPFIIDSPFGKELDDENIDLIHNFLLDKLTDNQLIVASIKEFNGCSKTISIKEKAIEQRNNV